MILDTLFEVLVELIIIFYGRLINQYIWWCLMLRINELMIKVLFTFVVGIMS
jgi:hypothetical protein